jgi:hypothetical protein
MVSVWKSVEEALYLLLQVGNQVIAFLLFLETGECHLGTRDILYKGPVSQAHLYWKPATFLGFSGI